ncbi:hypothetical protein TSO221_08985 [Azospirillum sp. TSO22-1]|nr:hypothetical protein TSO221_08985 [Azospirillum sp. TSO22-1]
MAARRAKSAGPATRLAAVVNELTKTAGKHGEMGVAAARTIGYRTAMMAGTLTDPLSATDPEFVRMGAEKVEAVAEATSAMAVGVAELQHAWLALFTGPVQAATLALASLGTCRSPLDLVGVQQRWWEESVSAGMNAGMHFVESAASLAGAGLPAFHRRARANARRLARVQR